MPPIHPAHRSLGRFLCHHPLTPPVEDTDRLPWQDIKQDACLRALVALQRAGKPTGPDPVAAFDAEPRLVRAAYQRARRDALRRHLGRNTPPDRHAARWQRLVSLDRGLDEIADPRQAEALDRVLAAMAATARLLAARHGGLAGLPPARTRRLLRVLQDAQRLKEEGTTVVPPHLRQRLRLLRRATGLPLTTRLL